MRSMSNMENTESKLEIASYIEHTMLKADCTLDDITTLCKEAIENKFVGICVPPFFVQHARNIIKKNPVKIITVVGFPLGYNSVSSKVEETKKAIISGAHEIDMVMNIAAFKSKDFASVQNDIQSVSTACHLQNRIIKVIIETSLLDEEEIKLACKLCTEAEADYVKTSTGFAASGATVEAVQIMRATLPKRIKIKAAGGIRDFSFAQKLIEAGADRIGTSSGVKILEQSI